MSNESTLVDNDRPATGWTPMLFIGLGVAVIIMDATIVNVILPSIIKDLGINSIDAEWINAVYALTFASLLIVMGGFGDRLGRRKIFILGALLFAASSILAASSTSGGALIGARAVQGIGGAMMSPTSLSLVNSIYRGKARAIAFAFYGSIIGGMAAIGPLLGGWLTETFSWHWSFWINVPIALFIAFGAWKFVPESKADMEQERIDFVGAIFSTLGTAALIFGLIEGRNYGWWKETVTRSFIGHAWQAGQLSPVACAFILSAVSIVILYVVETRRTKGGHSALIDFDLFKIRTFGLGSFAGLIVSLGEFGILFSLPLFMQSVLGWSALGAGGLLATLAVGAFFAAPTAGILANKRNPRFVARLGLILEIIGIIGISVVISPTTSGWQLGAWLFVYGVGVGYATAQLTGLILADVPMNKSGQASGTQSTARQIGAAMGTAILGTILFVSLHNNTVHNLNALSASGTIQMPAQAIEQVASAVEQSAGTIIPAMDNGEPGAADIQHAASVGYADAVRVTAYAAAGFLILGLLATLALPPGRSRDEELPNGGEDNEPNQTELIHDFE